MSEKREEDYFDLDTAEDLEREDKCNAKYFRALRAKKRELKRLAKEKKNGDKQES